MPVVIESSELYPLDITRQPALSERAALDRDELLVLSHLHDVGDANEWRKFLAHLAMMVFHFHSEIGFQVFSFLWRHGKLYQGEASFGTIGAFDEPRLTTRAPSLICGGSITS